MPPWAATLQIPCTTANISRTFFEGSRRFCMEENKKDRRALTLSYSWSTLFTCTQLLASSNLRALSVGVHQWEKQRFSARDAVLENTSLTHGCFNPASIFIHGLNIFSLERLLLGSCGCCPSLWKILFLWCNCEAQEFCCLSDSFEVRINVYD